MFNDLTGLGYGLVVFAIIIGVGTVVLYNFSTATAGCATGWTYNATSQLCGNTTATADPSAATTNGNYLMTQLGQSGLAGWTPAIIAISIGILFLGAFMVKGGRKGRY